MEGCAVIIYDLLNNHYRTAYSNPAVSKFPLYQTPKCTADPSEPGETHFSKPTGGNQNLHNDRRSFLLNNRMAQPCLTVRIKLWHKVHYSGCCTKLPRVFCTSPSSAWARQVPDKALSRHIPVFVSTWVSTRTGIWLRTFIAERPLHKEGSPVARVMQLSHLRASLHHI